MGAAPTVTKALFWSVTSIKQIWKLHSNIAWIFYNEAWPNCKRKELPKLISLSWIPKQSRAAKQHLLEGKWPTIRHTLFTHVAGWIYHQHLYGYTSTSCCVMGRQVRNLSYQLEVEIGWYACKPMEERVCRLCHWGTGSGRTLFLAYVRFFMKQEGNTIASSNKVCLTMWGDGIWIPIVLETELARTPEKWVVEGQQPDKLIDCEPSQLSLAPWHLLMVQIHQGLH